jgi:nucleotide-binding universal stress UspA family protein
MKPNQTNPILCGTDFSKNAQEAADIAAVLATRLNTSLVLVHAHLSIFHAIIPDVNKTSAHLRECLHQEAERLRTTGVIVEEEFSDGTPSDVLVRIASQRNARLLVVSSLGLHGASRWLIGSVAERTAESSKVPTLVVRESAPFEKWARGEQALKVFVAVDFGSSSDAALRWVAELQKIGPCEVTAAYVGWPPEEASRLGVSSGVFLSGNQPEMQGFLERDLREKVTRVLGEEDVRVSVCANWGRADYPLVAMAKESGAVLIICGTHQRHGLSRLRDFSVSRGILGFAPMSVVCVPTPAAARMVGPRVHACQRVLVAVDLNEPHGFAAAYGYSIINPGGTVRLVYNHVPALQLTQPNDEGPLTPSFEEKLLALAPEKSDAPEITTEVEVTQSWETAEAICTAAERFGADIICVGSHTRPGFSAKVLGSVVGLSWSFGHPRNEFSSIPVKWVMRIGIFTPTFFPAFRSGSAAVSGTSPQKQIPY